MEKVQNIVSSIEHLTALELVELQKQLEKSFGIDAKSFAFGGGSAGAAASTEAGAADKGSSKVTVFGTGFNPDQKIAAIKAMKDAAKVPGLTEAKGLVERMASEKVEIIKDLTPEEAKKLVETLSASGITTEVK